MALLFCEGFDHLDGNDLGDKWTTKTGSPTTSGTAGRTGNGLSTTSGQYLTKTFGTSYSTLIAGVAIKLPSGTPSGQDLNFLRFMTNTLDKVEIWIDDGVATIYTNNVYRAQSTIRHNDNDWHYYELKATQINSGGGVGNVVLRMDGEIVATVTNVPFDTSNFADFNRVEVGNVSSFTTWYFDDFYVCDDSTSFNNDFLGEIKIETRLPNANGTTNNFTPSAGSNFQNVDENPSTDDTDYNSSATLNHIDLFTYPNFSSTVRTIFGVQVNMYARKTDASSRDVASHTKSSSTSVDGTSQPVTQTYKFYNQILQTDPNTSAAWTETNLEAAEFGYKVSV